MRFVGFPPTWHSSINPILSQRKKKYDRYYISSAKGLSGTLLTKKENQQTSSSVYFVNFEKSNFKTQ